jgi:hypothetical protein
MTSWEPQSFASAPEVVCLRDKGVAEEMHCIVAEWCDLFDIHLSNTTSKRWGEGIKK